MKSEYQTEALKEYFQLIPVWSNEIEEQIEIFSNAEKIIAPHGSNLANIVFCSYDLKNTYTQNHSTVTDFARFLG